MAISADNGGRQQTLACRRMRLVGAWPDQAICRRRVTLARTGEAAASPLRIPLVCLDARRAGSDHRSALRSAKSVDTQSECSRFGGTPEEERDDMTESQIQVQSASQVQAAPSGLYNFNLNVSGQLQLAGQETDTVQETEDETVQTS